MRAWCLVASVVPASVRRYGLWPARLLCPRGSPRQEYWSGLPCLPPRDLPDPGIKSKSPVSPALQVDCLPTEPHGKPQYISATLESLMKMCLQKNVKIKTIWRKIQMTEQKGRAATVSFTLSPPLGTHQHVLNCQNVVTVVLLD